MLSGYQYKLRYRPGMTNANTDALNRLPLPVKLEVTEDASEPVLSLHILEMTPARLITTVQLRQFTDRDGQTGTYQALCVEWLAKRSGLRVPTLLESPARAKCLGWLYCGGHGLLYLRRRGRWCWRNYMWLTWAYLE